MIRNAVYGLAFTAVVLLVLLSALGFQPADFAGFFEQPYPEALKQGKYMKGMTLWVDGRDIGGEHSFEIEVRNPTTRPLALKGAWNEEPGRFTISPIEVGLSLAPRESKSLAVRMNVTERDAQGNPIAITQFRPPVFQGRWTWEKFAPGGQVAEALEVDFQVSLRVQKTFGSTNYVVVGAYLLGMLAIGVVTSRSIKGTRDFFIAQGKINHFVVAISITATYLSALTMMALPGMAYGEHDWTYTIQLPCLIITAMIITGFVLPRYRAAGIISIYGYLEQRIDVSARLMAAICFVVFSVGRMGLLLYLPALALHTTTGTPLALAIILMGFVTTAYTAMGGIEAVIWTDAVQALIFVLVAIFPLVYIFNDLGAENFIAIAVEHNKFRTVIPEFDPVKITTLWLILETLFQTVRIYGTQQDIAQRYMTTQSTEKANQSVWIAIVAYIPLGFIFYFSGTAIFAFFKAHPAVNLPAKADQIYPHFAVNYLPNGIAGLVIAGIFAAAMSSIDALMNSSSAVCIEDFYKRFARKQSSEEEYLKKAKDLTWLWGALAIGMGLLFMQIQYAQIVWGKVMGISTNGILGLMALAFLPFKVNKWAAATGFVLSYFCLFTMMAIGVNFLLWPVIGNLVCFFVALFLHPIYSGRAEAVGKD